MRPLSNTVAKPLMPLWNKPLLQHALELLADWGVRDITVNCHHHADQVFSFLREVQDERIRISVSFEPQILGTGGAIARASWMIDDDQPFWVMNADVAADLDPTPILKAYGQTSNTIAALWMYAKAGPRTVEIKRGRIRTFRSRKPGARGTYTFCGLHLLSPRILEFLPEEGFAGIIEAYERAMAKRRRIAGVTVEDAFWADLGTPERYLAAHRDVRERHEQQRPGTRCYDPDATPQQRNITVRGFAAVAPGVQIAPGARLKNVVAWNSASFSTQADAHNAIVAEDVDVPCAVEHVVVHAEDVLRPPESAALKLLGWPTSNRIANVLPARGSARSFIRLRHGGRRRAMLIRYNRERRENALYAGHARLLKQAGFPVPDVLCDDPHNNFLVMEDAGTQAMIDRVHDVGTDGVEALYRKVLDAVVILHREGTHLARRRKVKLMPPFTAGVCRWEHELFAEHYLHKDLGLRRSARRAILTELEKVGNRLARAERVLIHRDLQSSNIILRRGKPVFIDFQGMRMGPAVYDLASLLCDPYVSLPEPFQEKLLAYYAEHNGEDAATLARLFWPASVQRLAQATGAYARLAALPGAHRFADHIPAGLRMLDRALAHTDELPRLQDLVAEQCAKHEA